MARGRLYIVYFISIFAVTLQRHIRCKPPKSLDVDIGGGEKYLRNSDINEYTATTEETDLTETTDLDIETDLTETTDLSESTTPKSRRPRKPRIPKQKTFIRNPNYIAINKKLDKLAKNMYIMELPLPAPGAMGGSSRGCTQYEIIED
ncbi:hypothetical protein AWZ03_006936 [Drosophila navojoa]|uniref:Uncharacterized protein n=1 Tax=Drosophila navojoa TaxID=7232 RepID=A0A484BD76_DRONA|nr:hypothetical protein AWZ03_006936 [Drosophila navojoa]